MLNALVVRNCKTRVRSRLRPVCDAPEPQKFIAMRASSPLSCSASFIYIAFVLVFLATIELSRRQGDWLSSALYAKGFAAGNKLVSGSKLPGASFYDLDTVPSNVVSYARKWIADSSTCANDDSALQVRCCKASPQCGGISDRVRGISTLLRAAAVTNRKLCFTKSHFMLGPLPDCSDGEYRHVTYFEGEGVITADLFRGIKYVASNMVSSIPELGIDSSTTSAKKLGFVALALSGVLDDEISRAKAAIQAVLDLASENDHLNDEHILRRTNQNPFLALHVRCGGATFENTNGETVACNDVRDGFNTSIPDSLLRAARTLPRNLYCQKPLFLASDSARFIAELQIALPNGVAASTCCNSPLHIDKTSLVKSRNKQHIVDMTAFSLSSAVFGTRGGYAQLGTLARNWNGVKMLNWPAEENEDAANRFLGKLRDALDCQLR